MSKSDADLVLMARQGNQAAIGEIYDRYADRLFGFAFSMLRDREEAADAVHDVILRSSQKLDQLRDPSKLRPWLFSIARNEVMSRTRQRSRRDNREVPDMAADLPDSDNSLIQNELQQLVWDAADGLQQRDRELLELQMQGLEGEELAEALGVKLSHVHVLSSRMRDRMEKAVGSLLIARLGRDDCDKLNALLSDWDGHYSLEVRSKVTRHIEDCDICTKKRGILCAPGSIALALPFVAIPVSLKSKVLNSVSNANATTEPSYTNPHKTQWDWDTQSGFPVKAKVITKTVSLASLTAGLFIAAAVVTGAFIITGNDNEPSRVTTQEVIIENPTETQSSSNNEPDIGNTIEPISPIPEQDNNPENLSSSFELVETTSNYTCNEGEYCSFDAYLSEDPLDIIRLTPNQISCQDTDFELINSSARWDSRNWRNIQQIKLYAIDDNVVQGDRTCEIIFSLNGTFQPLETTLITVTFTIADNDIQTPEPTPQPSIGLSVNTNNLSFGNQANSRELIISNDSDSPINWTIAVEGKRFGSTANEGRIDANGRLPLKILFERTQPVEGDFNGVLTIEGNGQLIQVNLSAQIEIPPVIEFFYSDPKVVYISNTNCGSSEATLGASIYDDANLSQVEIEWTRNNIDIITTPLQLVSNQIWIASLSGFETGAVPSIEAKLTATDSRGNQSQASTIVGVRLC
ncbi:MAG: RNA polymerase sigma factor [Actinomycetota bacterium]|nr:RNA polymerase sigma factor [Actinomycetota bacterium]